MLKSLPQHLRYKINQKGQKVPLTKKQQQRFLRTNPFLNHDFHYILMNRKVSQNFMRKAINLYGLPEEINEFLFWGDISQTFIRQYQSVVDWSFICWQQNLSKDFIREFEKKFNNENWEGISSHQKLDIKFLRQKRDKLDIVTIIRRGYLDEEKVRQIFRNDI